MPDFDWLSSLGVGLQNRFPDNAVGIRAWTNLTDNPWVRRPIPVPPEQCQRELERFLGAAANELRAVPPDRRECRVFVSHRKCDVKIADRIAYLAVTKCDYGYWLDIDDPVLKYIDDPDVSISSPVKEMLIAAIIEMGLINSTHCIATITWNSEGSKWIPYEFGRAKRRQLFSVYSASWLWPAISSRVIAEYLILATVTEREEQILNWLKNTRNASSEGLPCVPAKSVNWRRGEPAPLPISP
jgi:hypothetical protein